MRLLYRLCSQLGLSLTVLSQSACSAENPLKPVKAQANMLCPPTPNCVSSYHTAENPHWTAPLELLIPADQAWPLIAAELESTARTRITHRSSNEIRAEVRSVVFGFVDDVLLRLEGNQVMLFSASRVGYSDLGVNRRRVNLLREQLQQKMVVR